MKHIIRLTIIILSIVFTSSAQAEGFGYGKVLKHGTETSKVCVKDTRKKYPVWYLAEFHKSLSKDTGAAVITLFLGKEVDEDSKTQYEDQCLMLELREGMRWEIDSNAKNGEYKVFQIRDGQYLISIGTISDQMEPWITIH